MNFQERISPTTTVKVLSKAIPYVLIGKDAISKMFLYVDKCAEEVGWLGTAYRNGKEILITDVYLFDQEVHATTTEITPEGLATFAEEILALPEGVEIWNNLKVWGHSHVNMGITPSSQDDKQMETFQEGGHDWFIRIIANKKGDLKVDLYDYEHGVIYIDLPWEVQECEEELRIHLQLQELYRQLDAFKEERVVCHDAVIAEEMKLKVRKKTYSTYANGSNYAQRGTTTSNPPSTMKPTSGVNGTTNGTETVSDLSDKKKPSEANVAPNANGNGASVSAKGNVYGSIGRYSQLHYFETDDEVRDLFDWKELLDFAECKTLDEVEDLVQLYGYYNYFTEQDLETILRVAKKVQFTFDRLKEDGEI